MPIGVVAAALFCLPITVWAWAGLRFYLHGERAALALIIRAGITPLILLITFVVTLRIAP
jgi:hypothetical protein